jgi:dTDP-4-amino-4,6-dideoxygalactose transaminase
VPADQREAVAESLRSEGVATAVYYPVPLHLQPALASFGYRRGQFPQAERAARETLALPIFPGLDEARAEKVVAALSACFA